MAADGGISFHAETGVAPTVTLPRHERVPSWGRTRRLPLASRAATVCRPRPVPAYLPLILLDLPAALAPMTFLDASVRKRRESTIISARLASPLPRAQLFKTYNAATIPPERSLCGTLLAVGRRAQAYGRGGFWTGALLAGDARAPPNLVLFQSAGRRDMHSVWTMARALPATLAYHFCCCPPVGLLRRRTYASGIAPPRFLFWAPVAALTFALNHEGRGRISVAAGAWCLCRHFGRVRTDRPGMGLLDRQCHTKPSTTVAGHVDRVPCL